MPAGRSSSVPASGCGCTYRRCGPAGFEVVALVGQDAERTTRRAARVGVPAGFDSLPAALEATDADVVTIATPPDTHAELAVQAIAAGRHVICEKPLALSVEQAEAMTKAADAAGLIALVGTEFRWDPAVEAVRAAIAVRPGGPPAHGHGRTVVPDPGRRRRRHARLVVRSRPAAAGGCGPTAPTCWTSSMCGSARSSRCRPRWGRRCPGRRRRRRRLCRAVPHRVRRGRGASRSARRPGATPVELTRVAGTAGTVSIEDGHAFLYAGRLRRLTPRPATATGGGPGDPRPWTTPGDRRLHRSRPLAAPAPRPTRGRHRPRTPVRPPSPTAWRSCASSRRSAPRPHSGAPSRSRPTKESAMRRPSTSRWSAPAAPRY